MFQSLNPSPDGKVIPLADGEGIFHRAIGLTQKIPGLGGRSQRYAMYLENGVVKILNVEEINGEKYKFSGPEKMLRDIKALL